MGTLKYSSKLDFKNGVMIWLSIAGKSNLYKTEQERHVNVSLPSVLAFTSREYG